jgi:hypothetical protein
MIGPVAKTTNANQTKHQARTMRARQGACATIAEMRTKRDRSGKTPYGDNEDPFNAGGIRDDKSNGIASQSQGDEEDNVVEPDGQHDTRVARAQQQQSADNAALAKYARHQPTWGQPLVAPTTMTTPAMGKTAYLGLTNMLDWGVAHLTDKNKISSELN